MPVEEATLTVFEGKKVLVTGGTGMIGRQVVDILCGAGAKVTTVSLDPQGDPRVTHVQGNLRDAALCRKQTAGMEYVFHLAGLKGSAAVTSKYPADYLVPMLQMDTNMLEACQQAGVPGLVYASSIGAYAESRWPFSPLREAEGREGEPMDLPGAAKRAAEYVIDSYRKQYDLAYVAVRLAAVYGPGDHFNSETSMVIPALLAKVRRGDLPFIIEGWGTAVRDFIFSRNAAEGMILAMLKQDPRYPFINIGSGRAYSIKEVAGVITRITETPHRFTGKGPLGFRSRVLDTNVARKLLGFEAQTPLWEGIKLTWAWLKIQP